MSIGIVAGTLVHFYTYVLRMQERGIAYSLSRFLPKLLLFILLGIGVLFHFVEYSFLLIAQISSVVVSLFVFTVLLKTSLFETLSSTVDVVLLKKLFRYSLPLMAGDFAYWGLTTSDRFLLRYLAGFEELGFYSVAVLFSGAAFVLTGIFSTIWHPQVYKWAQDETKSHELSSFFEPVAAAIFFIWSCTGLFLKPVLLLLPEKYSAIEPLILLNLSVPLLFVLSETTVIGIHLSRKSFWSMLASFVAFALNGLLNLVFIPKYGALGASAASAVAFYVFFVMRTEASARIWFSFPRLKLHVLGLLFPLVAFFQSMMMLSSLTKLFLWSLLLLITIILFKDQWKQWITLILKRF
jgi:O-antigen/teichoic acid export membrane protein